MPKDEAASTDPMELNELVGPPLRDEDVDAMTDALIDEYIRLGFDDEALLSLFRNPHYTLTHWIWLTRGERYAREAIARVRARWGNVWRFQTRLGPAAFTHDAEELDEDETSDFVPVESLGRLRS